MTILGVNASGPTAPKLSDVQEKNRLGVSARLVPLRLPRPPLPFLLLPPPPHSSAEENVTPYTHAHYLRSLRPLNLQFLISFSLLSPPQPRQTPTPLSRTTRPRRPRKAKEADSPTRSIRCSPRKARITSLQSLPRSSRTRQLDTRPKWQFGYSCYDVRRDQRESSPHSRQGRI
jgi:hypothetical protein